MTDLWGKEGGREGGRGGLVSVAATASVPSSWKNRGSPTSTVPTHHHRATEREEREEEEGREGSRGGREGGREGGGEGPVL